MLPSYRNKMQALLLLLLFLLGSATLTQRAYAQIPYTWGYNNEGELGDGTNTTRNIPKKSLAHNITNISAGGFHTLAVKSDGTAWAWGFNRYGQLGEGTNTDNNTPVQVSGLTGVVQVSGGYDHSLALKSDGTVWAWGYNYYGALGDGTNTDKNTPVQVSGLTGIVQVSAGQFHSLAVKSDGTVWAWGYNGYGALGNGTNTDSNSPVQVSGLTGIVQVSAGGYYSLALKSDGTVWAWGYNGDGELGDGTGNGTNTPVQTNISNVVQVSAGGYHSLVVKSDGTAWGFGYNGYGELGDGTYNNQLSPVQVVGLTGVAQVSAGFYHSLALLADGTLYGFGYNGYGQLGNGTNTNSNTPVLVALQGMTLVSAGWFHSVAIGNFHATTVTVPAQTSAYGATVLAAKLTLAKTGFPLVQRAVTFLVDGVAVGNATTDASGIVTLPALVAVGTHKLTVTAPAIAFFDAGTGKATLTVTKSDTTLKSKDATLALGETISLTATLTRSSDGTAIVGAKVTFSIDGVAVKTVKTDSTGVASLIYKADGTLGVGGHKLDVAFAGDGNYNPSATSNKLTINKALSSLTEKNAAAKPNAVVNLYATLTRFADGAPLANQKVVFYVGGQIAGTGITDVKGVATIAYTCPQLTAIYFMKVVFAGDASYVKSSYSNATLTVK